MGLVDEALRIAAEYDLAVFPVGSDKRPILKGWRAAASSDPAEIREMFARSGASGVGVPCGPENDIVCFDLDFGHADDQQRRDKLSAWLERWHDHIEANAMVRQTPSGGLHVIYGAYPDQKVPRRIMPKFDVILDGFYFVWHMEGGGYVHLQGDLKGEQPDPGMLEVVERDQFGDGSALMTSEAAHEAMWSNGDSGIRHDALLRMTQDWANENPSMSSSQLCASFAQWFEDIYGDRIEPDRLRKLIEWRCDARTGDMEGELGRAFAGVANSPESANASLAAALAQHVAAHGAPEPLSKPARLKQRDGMFVRYDREEDVTLAPWVIEHICRVGDLGGFAGIPGLGKTNLSAAIIAGLTSGNGPAVGLPNISRPWRVAWANPEEPREALKLRLDAVLDTLNVDPIEDVVIAGSAQLIEGGSAFLYRDGRDMKINEQLVKDWVRELQEYGVEVLVLDPLTEFNDGNENDRGDRKMLVTAIRQVAQRAGLTVLYWAHTAQKPEGKRDDWYANDLFAERGSSGGVAANQFGGTLVRVYPPGYKGDAAERWASEASNPAEETPNIVRLSVIKSKLGIEKPTLHWRIDISEKMYGGDHMPVAVPLRKEDVDLITQAAAAADINLVKVPQARALIDLMGDGTHNSLKDVHERMLTLAVPGWPTVKTLRADQGVGSKLLDMWRKGVEVEHKGDLWSVSMVNLREGKTHERFCLTIVCSGRA